MARADRPGIAGLVVWAHCEAAWDDNAGAVGEALRRLCLVPLCCCCRDDHVAHDATVSGFPADALAPHVLLRIPLALRRAHWAVPTSRKSMALAGFLPAGQRLDVLRAARLVPKQQS